MSDISDNKNASNYSVQPGYSKDYPPQGTPMDPKDHSAANVPTATEDHQGTQKLKDYMQGMTTLASSPGARGSAGQYGADSTNDEYNKARKRVGLDGQ